MLELVVSDDLTPPLECPSCGRLYASCSFPIAADGPRCQGCGGSFRLLDLLPKQQRKQPVPPGISVVDDGKNWTVDVSTRSLKKAILSVASALALVAIAIYIWMHGGWLFGDNTDADSAFLRKMGAFALAGSIGLLGSAVWQLWGRYSVSVAGGLGTVFDGIGRFGNKRHFTLPAVNGVCLTKAVYEDRRGNQIEAKIVRLEGVGFYMDIARDLPDVHRAYVALFLLQKRLELERGVGAGAGP